MQDLVLQALQPLTPDAVTDLATALRAQRIEQPQAQVLRLRQVTENRAFTAEFCEARQIDWAFVTPGLRLSDIGLVVMDMDSTLINIECIDEIADMLGIKPQVSEITESAMRGEIDFRESLTRRVKLLTGLDEEALDRVYQQRLRLNPGAETMLARLHAAGAKSLLISGGFTYFTHRLQERLSLTHTIANTLGVHDGQLTGEVVGDIIDANAKFNNLVHWREKLGLRREQVIALGDGANDLKMLAEAGMGIAYHAKPIVRQQAQFSLTFVGLDGLLNWFE